MSLSWIWMQQDCCKRLFHPAKNKMLGQYWILVIYGREKKWSNMLSLCVQSMLSQLSRGQSPIPPCGPVEQPWCISAYDKCAGRPWTRQATGNLLCSVPWNKQIGRAEKQLTKNNCLASNWPVQSTWMNVSVGKLEANETWVVLVQSKTVN